MRQLIPFILGFAVGATIILTHQTNIGLFVGVLAFWTITALINKLLRSQP